MSDWMPERRLWQAVILQAIADACNEAWRHELERKQAITWLQGGKGFIMVCDMAGWSPDYVKEKFQQKMDKRINGKQWRVYPEHKRT